MKDTRKQTIKDIIKVFAIISATGILCYKLGQHKEIVRNRKQFDILLNVVKKDGDALLCLNNGDDGKLIKLMIKEISSIPDEYKIAAPFRI